MLYIPHAFFVTEVALKTLTNRVCFFFAVIQTN
ncbi:ATP-dependent Clp protease adaptor protein ClpS [Vibrio mediterranei AK1]|nr:ATP-dependent Clp protease adaptor protein ClpS [Vibrio mediterranei AK1]